MMQIAAIAHAVPSERITNGWILEQFRTQNASRVGAPIYEVMDTRLRTFFEQAGTEVRYRLAPGEKVIDLVRHASTRALSEAGVAPWEVDCVVYASVARGTLEPATATFFQHELGLVHATAFDVLDACASWLRALDVLRLMMQAGPYRRALILTAECGFAAYGNFDLRTLDDVDARFAMCTIGEAVTATVVTAEPREDDFYCVLRTFGEGAELCMLPLTTLGPFLTGPPPLHATPLRLYTKGHDLLAAATRRVIDVFESDPVMRHRHVDVGFGHAASEKASAIVMRALRLPAERYYRTHARYGNTVSSSIPLGMSLAQQEGHLQRGHRVLVIVAASGIQIGLATFTY